MVARFSGTQEVRDALNSEFPTTLTPNTPNCSLASAGGKLVSVSKQLTGSGASTANLFTLSGHVRILQIHCHVTAVSDSTTLSGFHIEANDGTNTIDLTKNTLDLSGCTVSDLAIKTGAATADMVHHKADQVRYDESSGGPQVFQEGVLSEKAGATNVMRVAYTGDASTDVTITFCVRYQPLTSTGSLVAA